MGDPAEPWTQRDLYSFCTSLPDELRVVTLRCWIDDFRKSLTYTGDRFPVKKKDFHSLALQFGEDGRVGLSSARDFAWVQNGEVKALHASFDVDFSQCASAGAIRQ